jgi:hypothetical protein
MDAEQKKRIMVSLAIVAILLFGYYIYKFIFGSKSEGKKKEEEGINGTYVSKDGGENNGQVNAILNDTVLITFNPELPDKRLGSILIQTKQKHPINGKMYPVYKLKTDTDETIGYMVVGDSMLMPLVENEKKKNKFIQPPDSPVFTKVSNSVDIEPQSKPKKSKKTKKSKKE